MKTICVDPVTPQLLIAGHLSFVTVDRPPPVGWIGQRVAIYASPTTRLNGAIFAACCEGVQALGLSQGGIAALPTDAIVGSGTLAEALRIRSYADELLPDTITVSENGALHIQRLNSRWTPGLTPRVVWSDLRGVFKDGAETASDQYPLQDWSPTGPCPNMEYHAEMHGCLRCRGTHQVGRWALRFTDVVPTIPCPDCNGDGIDGSDDAARFYAYSGKLSTCDTCDGMGTVSAPIVAPVLSGDDPTYKEWRP